MLQPDEICPTCHSKISVSGNRTRGQDGVDDDGNPIPFWSNDPILTPEQNNLNGDKFRGVQFAGVTTDIKEIQDDRKQKESDLGITPPTSFSDITENTTFIFDRHIIELRISTERILNTIGSTLKDFFSLDINGDVQVPSPIDTLNKEDWSDVSRGKTFNANGLNSGILLDNNTNFKVSDTDIRQTPGLPDQTFVRGLHIEDLRHPIQLTYLEKFTPAVDITYLPVPNPSTSTNEVPVISFVTNLINGDIFKTYDIFREITGVQYLIDFISPPFHADGIMYGQSNATVSTNILGSSTGNKIDISLFSESRKIDAGFSGGRHFLSTYSLFSLNKSFPEIFKRSPRKVTTNTTLELFFDYSLNGGPIPTGSVVGGSHPHIFEILFTFTGRPTVNLDNPNVQINAELLASKPLMGGSFVKNVFSFNNHHAFISSLSFDTITDTNDMFFNKQVLRIPLSSILDEFDLTEKYKFDVGCAVIGGLQGGPTAKVVSDAVITTLDGVIMNAHVTINGFRLKEIG